MPFFHGTKVVAEHGITELWFVDPAPVRYIRHMHATSEAARTTERLGSRRVYRVRAGYVVYIVYYTYGRQGVRSVVLVSILLLASGSLMETAEHGKPRADPLMEAALHLRHSVLLSLGSDFYSLFLINRSTAGTLQCPLLS